ncbi:MAG: yedY3, partial [Friedmanniella sp.]|nr:yedY3 [Friedmanniella sp.]
MTSDAQPPLPVRQPARVLRALAGVVAALAAVGVGHGIAALVNPVASPILAVGSTLIDAAPTPAKEFAVKTFGTNDKPILVSSIAVVLLVFAAVLGVLSWRHEKIALAGISLLGVAGIAAAVSRGSLVDGVPSLVAGIVGVLALRWMVRAGRARTGARDGEHETAVDGRPGAGGR